MNYHRLISILGSLLAALSISTQSVSAATDTWTGSGANNAWTNGLNWGVFAPSPGDFLSWGSGPTTSSNNFPAGTIFGNIAFNPGAASFTLIGNGILLTNLYDVANGLVLSPDTAYGSISNNSASAQFVNLPVEFMHGYHYIVTANGNLNIGGAVTRDTGAVITFYTNGIGNINLTGAGLATNNFNNLLGGWAVLNNTSWATLDVHSNVVVFTNYTINNSGGIDTITNGPSLNYQTLGLAPVVASGGATINSLQIFSTNGPTGNVTAGTISFANSTDILRLGQNGGIMLANSFNGANNNGGNWIIGAAIGSGVITAGTNGNSELFLCEANDVSSAGGQLTVNSVIADNGSGKVTIVKNGGQNLVFAAANSYSGGTYINQSRISATIAGAYGYGPIFVNNGGQLWARANVTFTNDLYLSGSGNGESQQFGAVRLNGNAGCTLSGTIHVNVATPKISNSGTISGKITGGAGMRFSSAHASGTSPTIISISNTGNDYAGDTIVWADGFGTLLRMGNSLVIPNGPGAGNLILTNSGHSAYLDLNGFNETVNGLISAPGTAALDFVTNFNGSVTATLTVGGNNATATFGGNIGVGNGKVALTKMGAGVETLSGANGYTGNTTVNSGTLALSGSGSISSSANVYLNGGTLDISGLPNSSTTVQPLFMTNAALTVVLNTSVTNITTTTLTTGGANSLINIAGVTGLSGAAYPTNFTLIKYSTFVSNSFFTFGTLVASTIQGYITNTGSAVVVVLTNGPKPLVWKGSDSVNPTFWDIATTTNWQFNGLSAVPFNTADSVTFDDTASTFNVNVTTAVLPGTITVTNATHNYTFGGVGNISGTGGLTKQGSGSLVLQENGDSFSGGVNVAGGSVTFAGNNTISGGVILASGTTAQVGTNGGAGTLPSGNVVNNGSLIFDVGANLSVPGNISGSGAITNEAAGILNLGGVNTFTNVLVVQQGTLQMGGPAALGAGTNGGTFISSGATLDVNSFSAGFTPVNVAGQGVGNNGAIINSGAGQQNALQRVTLAGNTTFGGTGRWDIRSANIADPSQGSLLTGGNTYNLAKTGVNQVSLVGITVDSALANVDIQQGMLSIESATTGLGASSGTVTVESGATLQLYQLTSVLDKYFVFNGDGVDVTLNVSSSTDPAQNTIQPSVGNVTVNGACIFNLASGSVLNIGGNPVVGSGSLTQNGAGTFTLTANSSYAGNTTINGGAFILNGVNSGGGTLNVATGATLAGAGGNTGPVIVAGNLEPGSSIPPAGQNQPGTFSSGPLTLSNATYTVDMTDSGGDLVAVSGNLLLSGINNIQPVPASGLTAGHHITIVTYTGTLTGTTNNLVLLPSPQPGYNFSLVDPATTPGTIQLNVDHVPANKLWVGGAPSAPIDWDNNITTNWYNIGTSTPGVTFTPGDAAVFNDNPATNLVNLVGSINVISVNMNNATLTYRFVGAGNITGVGGLTLNNFGTLIFANSGSNNFTGPIMIDLGTLVVGDGGTNGNIGSGPITDYSTLCFNRGDAGLTVSNSISGSGVISNLGPGVVTLSGNNNNFSGSDYLAQGTLRAANSTALGNVGGSTTVNIAGGATLDVTANTVNLGNSLIYVLGAGVSNNGAIVNNGHNTAAGTNFAYVTMQGDTTFGGSGRLDFRSTPVTINNANLDAGGNPYTLTKTGTNQFWISGVNVDSALGNILVTNGLLGIETGTTLGNPSYSLTVCTNATVEFYNLSNVLSKNLVLNNGATVVSGSGSNIFTGPITLGGTHTFNISSASLAVGSGGFTNSGGTLIKSGGGTLLLYSIPTNAVFDLTGGTLDVNNAGGTLNLGSGQTIRGSATLSGNLNAGSGATVSPGEASTIGTLTCLSNVTLNGTSALKLNKTVSPSNDVLNVAGSLTYGGTLTVTNAGAALVVGDSFKLFNAAGIAGNFTTTNLPSSATWNWNPATGTLTVLTIVPTGPGIFTNQPGITSFNLSGSNIVVSGTNGQSGDAYYLLQSTNIGLSLSQWPTVATNVLGSVSGPTKSFTFIGTNVVVPADAQQFYILSNTNSNH